MTQGETRITSSTGGQKGTKFQRPGLIPPDVLLEFSQIYTIGAKKYDDNNWRRGYDWHLSIDAAERHLLSFAAGEDYDLCKCQPVSQSPEYPCEGCGATGQKHILQAAWHCFTLAWYMDHKAEFDDRAIRFDEQQALDEANKSSLDAIEELRNGFHGGLRPVDLDAPYYGFTDGQKP